MQSIQNLKTEVVKILKKYQNEQKKCSYLNCNENSIVSHTISKSQLKLISPDGNLYKIEFNLYTSTFQMVKTGINKFSTFYGFCNIHDNNLFKIIDKIGNSELINNPIINEICYLSFYRLIIQEKYKKTTNLKSNPEISKILQNANISLNDLLSIGQNLALIDIARIENMIFKAIKEKKYSKIKYKIYKFHELPISFGFTFMPECVVNEENISKADSFKPKASMSFFSLHTIKNKYIIVCWLTPDNKICSNFLNQFIDKYSLLKFCMFNSENNAYNQLWWDNTPDEVKNQFLDYYLNLHLYNLP